MTETERRPTWRVEQTCGGFVGDWAVVEPKHEGKCVIARFHSEDHAQRAVTAVNEREADKARLAELEQDLSEAQRDGEEADRRLTVAVTALDETRAASHNAAIEAAAEAITERFAGYGQHSLGAFVETIRALAKPDKPEGDLCFCDTPCVTGKALGICERCGGKLPHPRRADGPHLGCTVRRRVSDEELQRKIMHAAPSSEKQHLALDLRNERAENARLWAWLAGGEMVAEAQSQLMKAGAMTRKELEAELDEALVASAGGGVTVTEAVSHATSIINGLEAREVLNDRALRALRAALAHVPAGEPVATPVAWQWKDERPNSWRKSVEATEGFARRAATIALVENPEIRPLYAAPPRAPAWKPDLDAPMRYQHVKRGTTYRLLAIGIDLQAGEPIAEGAKLAFYQAEANGRLWARPASEFTDGRFVALPPRAPSTGGT